jgi:hypothetical protein
MSDDISRSNSLADLRERFRAEHAAVAGALKNSLNHAMAAGDILLEAKLQLKHGQWLPWLESCGISERMAQRYMRLARNRPEIESNTTPVSDLGVRAALTLLSAPRDPLAYQLVNSAIEAAFDCEEVREIESRGKKGQKALAEAKAALDRIGQLAERQPELCICIEGCGEAERLIAACNDHLVACTADTGTEMLTADNIRNIANTWLAKVEAAA